MHALVQRKSLPDGSHPVPITGLLPIVDRREQANAGDEARGHERAAPQEPHAHPTRKRAAGSGPGRVPFEVVPGRDGVACRGECSAHDTTTS
eukprot:CAMPEP_0119352288 /NCGR_PEP_ID=MMETSP1334-20130426/1567_1 /TAXON_ID=127549 /ORGANISM="Calcidiscus leptoporus, Strain RCC1130" /LENGTH=91 /DNA_ID=CAMNT_0007365287 /DNA_START=512 /DNA_END=787 /DNA_ORIENTATION=+